MALTKIKAAALTADLIDETKLADNSIDSEHYNDGSIDNAHLADNAVGTSEIADDAVTADKLANAINTDIAAKAVLTGSTNNTITTVTGANAIQGEANLTFDGTRLSVGGYDPTSYYCDKFVFKVSDEDGITIASGNNTLDANENNYIMFASTDSGAGRYDGYVRYGHQSHSFLVSVNNGGGSGKNFFFESDGDFKIGDGDLVLGGTGHGINFADSQTNAGGMTSETLDSYEEGTWTPSVMFGGTSTGIVYGAANGGSYVKIGRQVILHGRVNTSNKGSSTGNATIGGFPFTAGGVQSGTSGIEGDAFFSYLHDIVGGEDHAHVMAWIQDGETQMKLNWNDNSGDYSALTNSNWENDTSLSFCAIYPVA